MKIINDLTKYKRYLTVRELKDYIEKQNISDDALVMVQRVEDFYYDNNGWGVYLKEGYNYNQAIKMNEKMEKEKNEISDYDPNKYITNMDDLEKLKEQYHPVWCAVKYNDDDNLFLDLHY